MDTKKKPLFIAFSSQKAELAKSTFTTLVASTMHYRLGYNIAVFDADFPQHSPMKMKARDLAMVMENEVLKNWRINSLPLSIKAYPITQHRADSVLDAARICNGFCCSG